MNVLAVGAHFDDIELGCGGSLARHARQGDRTFIFVATRSGYADPRGRVIRQDSDALEEGREAARILKARLLVGGYDTLHLSYDDKLICELKKVIEDHRIDTVYTHWAGDLHQDHSALARSTLTAARRVPRVLMYRSNYYVGDREFRGNFFVDVSDTVGLKLRALRAHRSEYRRIGKTWRTYWLNLLKNNGIKIGVEYAEDFEVVRFLSS